MPFLVLNVLNVMIALPSFRSILKRETTPFAGPTPLALTPITTKIDQQVTSSALRPYGSPQLSNNRELHNYPRPRPSRYSRSTYSDSQSPNIISTTLRGHFRNLKSSGLFPVPFRTFPPR